MDTDKQYTMSDAEAMEKKGCEEELAMIRAQMEKLNERKTVLRNTLKKYYPICVFCKRKTITKVCAVCSEDVTCETEHCFSVVGVCGHIYHYDCMRKHLKSAVECPTCHLPWKEKHVTWGDEDE